MNKLPLIVKSENIPGNCDVASVIRSVFRNNLEVDVDVSQRSKKIFEEYANRCKELRDVERELIKNEAINLLHRNKVLLKYTEEETEPFSYNLDKYCIIRNSEILPPVPFGFGLNVNRHRKCQIISEGQAVLPAVSRPKRLQIECTAVNERGRRKFSRPVVQKPILPVLLVAEPSKVYFLAYEVGNTYKHQTKLQNIGNFGCRFNIKPPVAGSPFAVDWKVLPGQTKLIIPGQSLVLNVSFYCKELCNITENIYVSVEKGKDVVISIVACRPDPFLIVSIGEEDVSSYLQFSHHETVMCHTLECGRCLLGTETTVVLTLLNIGSDARFFIMSEKSWSSFTVDNFKEDNTVSLEEFVVFPGYFSIKHNQVIDMYTTVIASHPGLYLAQAKLLCDNYTVQYLDFVAEAVAFDSEWIQFKDMEKSFNINIDDNLEAEWYIDLKVQMCTSSISRSFSICNMGGINLNYHWEIKEADIPGTENLPEDTLTISERSGTLLAKSQLITTISCHVLSAVPGRYRTLLVFIVDDLPRKCVSVKDNSLIIDESEENVVSLKMGVIEVWLECVKPCVIINPFLLDLSPELLQCGQIEFIEIQVSNRSPGVVDISLESPESSSQVLLYCEPSVFDINRFSSDKFVLIIEPIAVGFFSQIIKCVVNHGELVLDISVKGKCSSGYLTSAESCLDFGIVKKHCVPSKEIEVKNHYHDKALWILQELEYTKEGTLKMFDHNLGSYNAGYFCHKGASVCVDYSLIHTDSDGIHCSLLEWSVGNDCLYTQVIADVFTTDVSLNFISHTFDKLYTNVKVSLEVTARNHSPLSTKVHWHHPLGNKQNLLIEVEASETVLLPGGNETFRLYVTPVLEGQVNDFFVPCFVELQKYPLLLQINGTVEGLQVVFQWQAIKEHIRVFWPNPSSESLCTKTAASFLSCKDTSEEWIDENLSVQEEDDVSIEIKESVSTLVDEISTPSSEPYLNWPIIGGKYTRSTMEDGDLKIDFNKPWGEAYRSQDVISFEENKNENDSNNSRSLTFLNVPLKQLVTQEVYLFNETEIQCSFSCCMIHYGNICPPSESVPFITTIQKKVYDLPEADAQFLGTDREKGLSISVTPSSGILPPQGCIILKVTVCAIAWGDYKDTLQINVGHLPLFSLDVNVFCNAHAASIVDQNIRFGAMSYLVNDYKSRMLRVHNNSCLPICISWQMFADLPCKSKPFSVVVIDDFKSNMPFHLSLIPYVGIYCNEIFKIVESCTTVKPWSTKAIEIQFNPSNVCADINADNVFTMFKGYVIGYVYTDQTINGNSRKMGIELEPLTACVEATIQAPMISFLNVENYVIFKCKAWEVMEMENQTLVMENVVMLGNNSEVQLDVTVSVSKPFQIRSVCYQTEKQEAQSVDKISLFPRETCEVTVICKVTKGTLDEIFADVSSEVLPNTIKAACIKEGQVIFTQPAFSQELNLELRVYQPVLIVSPKQLQFGPVFVNQTKHKLLYIKSRIGLEKITVQFEHSDGSFSFDEEPEKSSLDLINNNFVISVSFTPRDSLCYNNALVIKNCLSSEWIIPLSGIGTWNYKDHLF